MYGQRSKYFVKLRTSIATLQCFVLENVTPGTIAWYLVAYTGQKIRNRRDDASSADRLFCEGHLHCRCYRARIPHDRSLHDSIGAEIDDQLLLYIGDEHDIQVCVEVHVAWVLGLYSKTVMSWSWLGTAWWPMHTSWLRFIRTCYRFFYHILLESSRRCR